MRFISSIVVLALFALSANAASIKKRGISAHFLVCKDHIDSIDAQITFVHTRLNAYTASQDINVALHLRIAEQALLERMKKAGTDCCSVTGIITDEEADTMLVTVAPVIPKATNALASLAERKAVFDSIHFATDIAKIDIKDLYTNTTAIYTCIHDIGSVQHPTYIPVINNYIN
ncbi:hypothetical protein HPULCUR_011484 [Helicostylum pulchrum]|uniref:Uncharacterized protein n=1 Tax=Helicostylum pulchrum TaxID=562976 RepID=A0ABP9YHW1_9FUNG